MKQFVAYLGAGGFNTVASYLLYLVLLSVLSYPVAYTVAYVAGIGLAYWLNVKYVFREKGSIRKVLLFPSVYLVQYLFGMILLYLIVGRYGISEKIAPVIVVVLSIPLTFILTKIILTEKKNAS